MNFLAHLYLSGENEKLMVGNFIGDYVKGRKYENFPEQIKQGILLHRKIDYYTDTHDKFKEAKRILVADFGLYSGIVVDLFYDYFLAKNWNTYSKLTLRDFSRHTHAVLLSNFFYLPARVQGFLPFLIQNKRLESYATIDGIQKSLELMSRYTSLPDKSKIAITLLENNQKLLSTNFALFMNDMINYVETKESVKMKKPGVTTRL